MQGTLEGSIPDGPPRGDEGFGYDPIFVPVGETRTVAELGNAWKQAILIAPSRLPRSPSARAPTPERPLSTGRMPDVC